MKYIVIMVCALCAPFMYAMEPDQDESNQIILGKRKSDQRDLRTMLNQEIQTPDDDDNPGFAYPGLPTRQAMPGMQSNNVAHDPRNLILTETHEKMLLALHATLQVIKNNINVENFIAQAFQETIQAPESNQPQPQDVQPTRTRNPKATIPCRAGCERLFVSNFEEQLHYQRVHETDPEKQRPWVCGIDRCKKRFIKKQDCKNHRETHARRWHVNTPKDFNPHAPANNNNDGQ